MRERFLSICRSHISLIAFCVLGLIWGSNFIYMKISTDYLSALQIVYMRVLFGFIAVFFYSLYYKKLRLSDLRHSVHFFVMSLLATSVYYFCFVKGTALLLSGIAGAVSASIPLFTFMLSVIFLPEEKVTLRKLSGITLGLLGVVIIALPSGDSLLSANVKGVLYIIAGAFSLGASFVYAKKFISPLNINPSALVTYQLSYALVVLAVIVDYNNLDNIFINTNAALGLIIGLGALGTGVAYIIYYFLVAKLGPITASSATYVPPLVALVIGAVLVGEPIALNDYIASALILAGVFLLKRK
ncbi:MAG: DMT family transporter [Deferribacterales bacterium]